ncbi:MAG: MerR family transcriptional regulator [Chloroflexi bacterium]|nr:MerR family transcriptional regulator [Chloroflexota bacterium]
MNDDRPATERYLQIGEAADRLGLTQRTLRYYEEKGLLKPPSRMEGGFRLYSAEDIERVQRIKELRDLLGFSLADIKEMVEAEDVKAQVRAEWNSAADAAEKAEKLRKAREVTVAQIAIIDQKMEQMAAMRAQLAGRMEKYEARLREWEREPGAVASPRA